MLWPVRTFAAFPRWIQATIIVLVVGSLVPFGTVADVPASWDIGGPLGDWVDEAVRWVTVTFSAVFDFINQATLDYLLLPLERWLLLIPWWLLVAVVGFISYRMVGRNFAAIAVLMMLFVALTDLFEPAMSTLSLVVVATLISTFVGIPTGILASKNDRFDSTIRPILDGMQTMPSFVYLIPVLFLFGLGKVPAVIATFIYSVPPIIRLTNLGIRQVDSAIVEAARSFGANRLQMLLKIEMPLAIPTIMAGLNQTIMMALAMVVIASMIGAKGVGLEVLKGINRLEVGRGLLAGLAIVVMAIILDRVTQGFAKSQRADRSEE